MVKHIIDASEFWANVSKELDFRKWSYSYFASLLGVSGQSLAGSRYHHSPLSISTVIQIAEALNVRPSKLLGISSCGSNIESKSDEERNKLLLELLKMDPEKAIESMMSSFDETLKTCFLIRASQLVDVRG